MTTYLVSDCPQPDFAVLRRVVPKLHVKSDFDGSVLSRDLDVQERYDNDPLRVDGSAAALGRQILDAMKATSPAIAKITLPTYVLHGEADTLVPPS